MNTSLGYAKKTLTNSNVLLSGGGDKALSEFIGSLNWDSTNKKLQYKSASSTDFTDLITFGNNAFNSTAYLPLTGGVLSGELTIKAGLNLMTKSSSSLGNPNLDLNIRAFSYKSSDDTVISWKFYSWLGTNENPAGIGYMPIVFGASYPNLNALVFTGTNNYSGTTYSNYWGINTSNPQYLFDVNGSINGTSIYLNGTALSTASTHAHGDYVTAIGTNGNTLTWSKGGTAQTAITVPYATNADKIDNYHANEIENIYYGAWCVGANSGTYYGKVAEFKLVVTGTVDVSATFLISKYTPSDIAGSVNILNVKARGSNTSSVTCKATWALCTDSAIPITITSISNNNTYYIRIYFKSTGWGPTYGCKLLNSHRWVSSSITNWTLYTGQGTSSTTIQYFTDIPSDETIIAISTLGINNNAATATKLATARKINGTDFDGTADITTAKWGTARTITIGNSDKSVDGSADVAWSLADIGAAALSHTHNYIEAKGLYTFTSSNLPNTFNLGISAGFVNSNSGFGSFGSVLTVRTYSGGGGTLQLYAPYSANFGGTHLKARFGNYAIDSGNSWTDLKTIAWTEDIPTVNNGNLYLQASGVTKATFTANLAGDSTFNIAEGTTDGTISVGGVDIPIHGLGDRAFDSTGYLPLAGGTMTGPVKRYYSSASDEPMIALTSKDLDVWLWRINNNTTSATTATSAVYGFGLKYIGTGNGNNNRLILFADNLNATQVSSFSITQDGVVNFTSTPKVNSQELYYAGNIPSNSSSAKGVVPAGVASSVYMTDANKNPSWTSIDSAVTSGSSNLVTSGAVFTAIANKVAGAVQYLGTITSEVEMKALSTAGYGDFARVATSFSFVDASGESVTAHVGDVVYLINNESNAYATSSNWVVAHTEIDTDTWTAASTSASGYIPKLVTGGTNLETPSTDYVLAYVNGNATPVWRKLPSNAYLNTWTAWVGATTDSNGTAGYMPAPTSALRSQFLRGDGSWVSLNNYSLPTATNEVLGGVKTGTAITDTTGYTAVAIKDGVIYYKDTNTTYSDFVKSGSTAAHGLVPKPSTTAGTTKYLREDATWVKPPNTLYYLTLNGTVNGTTSSTNLGTIWAPTSKGTGFLKCTDGIWSYDNTTYATPDTTLTLTRNSSDLTKDTWMDAGTFADSVEEGTWIISFTVDGSTYSGVFSRKKNDTMSEEINLHAAGTSTKRIYARTSGNKFLIATADNTFNPGAITFKFRKLI